MPARKSEYGRRPNARRMLAEELTRLRDKSGMSLSALSEAAGYDRTYLHKLEIGARIGSPEAMVVLDKIYGTDKELGLLWELAKDDAFADKYKRFMELEAQASVMHKYSVSTVPGLLQTEDYAREVLEVEHPRDAEKVDEQLALRLGRQKLLEGEDTPEFRAILDESVFHRPARSPKVWRAQLQHLLDMASRPEVTLGVLPFSAGLHDLLGGSLTILWLPNGKSVAYVESSKTGDLFEDPSDVEQLRLSYDRLRDQALSPQQSERFIRDMLEASEPCDSPDEI